MANDAVTSSNDNQNRGQETNTQQKQGTPATRGQIVLIGIGLLALALTVAYLFLVLWPSGLDTNAKGETLQTIYLFGRYGTFTLTLDTRLILTVMAAGALGSFIHTATSFSDYVGNEKLYTNWVWWYILRPFIGMILAVIFYLVIRGGFLSAGTEAGKINPFGIAALAGLVGMFSKQATDKLDELFTALFRTESGGGDAKRKDNLSNPVPTVTDIDPKSVEPKTGNLVVKVKGTGFISGSGIRINDVNRETEFNDATQLTAKLLPEDVAEEGELKVTVFNPGPGGGPSTPIKLKIATGPGSAAAALPAEAKSMMTPAAIVPAAVSPGAAMPAPENTLSPEPEFAAPPDPPDAESDIDGCDVEIEDATPDEDLPPAKGGVA